MLTRSPGCGPLPRGTERRRQQPSAVPRRERARNQAPRPGGSAHSKKETWLPPRRKRWRYLLNTYCKAQRRATTKATGGKSLSGKAARKHAWDGRVGSRGGLSRGRKSPLFVPDSGGWGATQLARLRWNHRIMKVGKDLWDHQVQPSPQHHHAC